MPKLYSTKDHVLDLEKLERKVTELVWEWKSPRSTETGRLVASHGGTVSAVHDKQFQLQFWAYTSYVHDGSIYKKISPVGD